MPPSLRSFSLDSRLFNPTLYSNVLKFWFDGLAPGARVATERNEMRWFGVGADETAKASLDEECRSRFGEALSSISPARYPLPAAWTDAETDRGQHADIAAPFVAQWHRDGSKDPDAALALTLLLDQIPRNIFRDNQALIYAHYDRIARAVFYALREQQLDQHQRYIMSPVHRLWFYMPLMHSESLADHHLFRQTVEEFKSRLEANGEDQAAQYVGQMLDFAQRHLDILQIFGRYPYRNKHLGRVTSEEEQRWLDEGGETFGS